MQTSMVESRTLRSKSPRSVVLVGDEVPAVAKATQHTCTPADVSWCSAAPADARHCITNHACGRRSGTYWMHSLIAPIGPAAASRRAPPSPDPRSRAARSSGRPSGSLSRVFVARRVLAGLAYAPRPLRSLNDNNLIAPSRVHGANTSYSDC